MASRPIQLPHLQRFSEFFPDFLRKELAPYPGRGALVARVVISATLSMILIETFRIPNGFIGPLIAFFVSRENLVSTTRTALTFIFAFLAGALFIPIGARFFASTPETHFLWVGCSIFLAFFLLRCLTNYGAALNLGLVVGVVVGIWYLPGPAETNVELTLWIVAATLTGALVTLCVEVVFYAIRRRDDLIDGLDARLALLQDLMTSYGKEQQVSPATQAGLAQFAIVGAGALRRHAARSAYTQLYRVRMTTLVSLVGRSIDFAAGLSNAYPTLPGLHERAARLSAALADIRQCLHTHAHPCDVNFDPEPSPDTPLMSEIEGMVALMPTIFHSEHAPDPELEPMEDAPGTTGILVPDAFSNPEHLRYILGGTLAAMLCYVFYVSLDWPMLSTSITTCILTALTTIGSSRQKQTLRVAGFVMGGVIAGIGSQIFILPYIDSIGGFTVLFVIVTIIAAWISTSSTRLSYAGVQIAYSFYLIELSDFSIRTDLTYPRDRALGILLGITMMWLVFERLLSRSAADEMVRIFVANLRLFSDVLTSAPRAGDSPGILKVRRLRDAIYRRFGEVIAQADAVPFQTGPSRPGDMAARDRIRRWQTSLRTFYLLETPLLQFRIFGKAESMTQPFSTLSEDFRLECSRLFLQFAASLEQQLATHTHAPDSTTSLLDRIDAYAASKEAEFSERERALFRVYRTVARIVDRLQSEIASEGLYEVAAPAVLPGSVNP
jgi:multidrug resistance protein MdtO